MRTRGQAALEFLTTYGWAFLILLVMIGAISYFGITNPSLFIPDRCTFAPEIVCEDFQLAYDTSAGVGNEASVVIVSLKQTIGRTVYLSDFSCTAPDGTTAPGYFHFDGDNLYSANKPLADPATWPIDATPYLEWEPREQIFVKCLFDDKDTYQGLGGERIKSAVTVSFRRRDDPNAFAHEVEGDVAATVIEN